MTSRFLPTICVAAPLFSVALYMQAQNAPVPPDVKAFAAQYVAAYNSKDEARLLALYPQQARACITPANKDAYDEMALQKGDTVPPSYRLSLLPLDEANMKALASNITFLVKPERELHIDYEYPGTSDGGTLVLWLVHQNGRWMADFPCMTAQAIQDYRDSAPDREHYKAIAAAIKEPLRSELLAMLRVHKFGEAETRYKEVTGGDMKTAMLVIHALTRTLIRRHIDPSPNFP